jgi:hypothetical protein
VSCPADDVASTCHECREPGLLVLCDVLACGRGYHLSCLKPPLKHVPRSHWQCPLHPLGSQ